MMYVATCHEALPITTLNSPVFDARLSIRCVYGRIARQAETPENLRANRPPSLLAHRDGGSRRAEAGTAAFTESPVSGLVEGKSKKIASYDRRGSPQRRQNMPQWQPLPESVWLLCTWPSLGTLRNHTPSQANWFEVDVRKFSEHPHWQGTLQFACQFLQLKCFQPFNSLQFSVIIPTSHQHGSSWPWCSL